MENIDEIEKAAEDKRAYFAVERLVLKCGIRADLNGCTYLTEAATIFAAHPRSKLADIYEAVGRIHDVKPKAVMRAISYAVAQAFGVADRLSELIGTHIPPSQIHGGLVIAYIGKLYGNPSLSDRKAL